MRIIKEYSRIRIRTVQYSTVLILYTFYKIVAVYTYCKIRNVSAYGLAVSHSAFSSKLCIATEGAVYAWRWLIMFRPDSDKVVFAEKKHLQSSEHLSGSKLLDNVPASSHSLVVGEGSKTHFTPKYSDTSVVKSVKQFEAKRSGSLEDKAWGKKRIDVLKSDPLAGGSIKTYDRRHIEQTPSEQSDKITVDWTSRNIPLDKSGKARNQVRSDEFGLSDVLTRKKSVRTENQMRNNIPVAALGDKAYRVPEHSSGFYAQGGLIPGSSIVIKKSGKPVLQKREGTTTVQKTLSTMTYAQKVAIEDEKYERAQVLLLNVRILLFHCCVYLTVFVDAQNGSTAMGRLVPSWEERTGLYIVNPQDEND